MNKFLSIIFLLIAFSSCNIKQVAKIDFLEKPKNKKELIERVNAKKNFPEWVNLKGKLNTVKADKETTLNINIKIRKDSLIWASVSAPFGIEIARIKITQESIYFLNRVNKTWLIKPINKIDELLSVNFSFSQIQNILTSNSSIKKLKYKFYADENFVLKTPNISYVISDTYRVFKTTLFNKSNMLYYEFLNFNEQGFAREVYLKIKGKETFEATLNYSKITGGQKLKFPFTIPNFYEEAEEAE